MSRFSIKAGECAVLGGPSGAGKSSILKMVYGNYAVDAGQIIIPYRDRLVDVASADPRTMLGIRRDIIGYVSQFLRTVPRVSALDVVAEPLVARGADRSERSRQGCDLACADLTCRNVCGRYRQQPFRAANSSG